MKTFEVDIEDKTYEVDAPDAASAWTLANQYHVQKLQTQKADLAKAKKEFDPLSGMSNTEKFFAGMGKRMADIGTLGLRDQPESDAALMEYGYATAGGVGADLTAMLAGGAALKGAGMAAQAVPKLAKAGQVAQSVGQSLMLPNTATKAIATGAGYGFATDSGGVDERLKSAGLGAVGGALFPVIGAAAKTTKALVEPLTNKGQQRIAARVLSQFGGDDLARAVPEQFVPGSVPTTAEAVGNEGLASLTQGLRINSPQFADELASRGAANRAARVGAVQSIAGDDAAMASALATRESVTNPLYDAASKAVVNADGNLKMILQKPSVSQAWSRAQRLAAENGETLVIGKNAPAQKVATGLLDSSGNPIMQDVPEQFAQYSGKGLHYLKMALDDMLDDPMSSIGRNEKRALMKTREQLLSWMDNKIPEYGAARSQYANLSKPINQMEMGKELFNNFQTGLAQLGANTREQANSFGNAVRDADLDALAQKITGVSGIKAKDILTKQQIDTLKGVGKDLARKAKSEDLARGLGSNTAKNLSTSNILRQAFGPLGLPQSWAESTALQTMFKPLNLVYGNVAEPRIADALGKGLLDVGEAQRLLQYIEPPRSSSLLGWSPSLGIAYSGQQ